MKFWNFFFLIDLFNKVIWKNVGSKRLGIYLFNFLYYVIDLIIIEGFLIDFFVGIIELVVIKILFCLWIV